MATTKMADSHTCISGYEVRALEFYSGIGGMHCALERVLRRRVRVLGAFDLNTTVNAIYKHNFPTTPHFNRNLCGLTARELDDFSADLFTMSPPCQPFTRQGKREDVMDHRTDSFLHLLSLLPLMKNRVKYVVVENVQGFEGSQTHRRLLETLRACGMEHREFLLSPAQFGIPNSRLRYYLVAKLKSEPPFAFPPPTDGAPHQSLPVSVETLPKPSIQTSENVFDPQKADSPQPATKNTAVTKPSSCTMDGSKSSFADSSSLLPADHRSRTISDFCPNLDLHGAEFAAYAVPHRIARRYIAAMDIVTGRDGHSCCFTKAYGHYVVGTGSILQQNADADLQQIYQQYCVARVVGEGPNRQSTTGVATNCKFDPSLPRVPSEPVTSTTQGSVVTSLNRPSEPDLNSGAGRSESHEKTVPVCHPLQKCCEYEGQQIEPQNGREKSTVHISGSEVEEWNPKSDFHLGSDPSQLKDCRQSGGEVNSLGAQSKKNGCQEATDNVEQILSPLRLRYFTEYEIASFLCFPPTFSFPESVTLRQRYKALGNSLNVHVVAVLMQCLFEEG